MCSGLHVHVHVVASNPCEPQLELCTDLVRSRPPLVHVVSDKLTQGVRLIFVAVLSMKSAQNFTPWDKQ